MRATTSYDGLFSCELSPASKNCCIYSKTPSAIKQARNDTDRDLLSLPARSGGRGIINPSKTASQQFGASKKVTESLASIIHQQSISYPDHNKAHQRQAKKAVRNCNRIAATEEAEAIKQRLSSSQQVAMDQASERGHPLG